MIIKKIKNIEIGGEKKISVSNKVEERETIFFHGKDVRSKKFQKRMNRKSNTTLAYAILINSIIIIGLIMVIWIVITTIGSV
ncbi:MAG: hypothetical protein ACFE85_06975 [Candidatus Hodarchaeota archaeon]